jgi:hypothetical protein
MSAALVIVGALVGPDLFAKGGQVLPGLPGQGLEFFPGVQANQDVPQIEKNMGDGLTQGKSGLPPAYLEVWMYSPAQPSGGGVVRKPSQIFL